MGVSNAAGKMTLGQKSEIGFMLVMPWFFRRLGVKYMLLVGMVAWAGRYLLFAAGDNGAMVWAVYAGILAVPRRPPTRVLRERRLSSATDQLAVGACAALAA